MDFRRLQITDLDACYANRLRALEHAPTAFLTTLKEAREEGNTHYHKIFSEGSPNNVIFGAILQGEVIATIGIYKQDRPKLIHRANIWGMYVDAPYRRAGVAARLLDLAIQHARYTMLVTSIALSVESRNLTARKLYESRGFYCWGTEPKAMVQEGTFYDEDHLVLML